MIETGRQRKKWSPHRSYLIICSAFALKRASAALCRRYARLGAGHPHTRRPGSPSRFDPRLLDASLLSVSRCTTRRTRIWAGYGSPTLTQEVKSGSLDAISFSVGTESSPLTSQPIKHKTKHIKEGTALISMPPLFTYRVIYKSREHFQTYPRNWTGHLLSELESQPWKYYTPVLVS